MPYPRTAGHPDYTRSGARFIPEIWSGKILEKFYDATVLSEIANTDYEGEIKKYGDTVIIRSLASVTISDYVVGQKLVNQRPTSTPTTLSIDKGKYWSVELDDVMDVQSDINLLNKWTADAAEQLKIAIETAVYSDILSFSTSQIPTTNRGNTAGAKSGSYALGASGSPITISPSNVLDYIVDCGSVLDEQNIPNTDRWMIIPVWMAGLIKKSDLREASMTKENEPLLRNGKIGMIDRFTLYVSNLLPTALDGGSTCYHIPFGHKMALTFASQISETETIRSQDTFADIVRGLNIYGYKVIQPIAIGEMWARK